MDCILTHSDSTFNSLQYGKLFTVRVRNISMFGYIGNWCLFCALFPSIIVSYSASVCVCVCIYVYDSTLIFIFSFIFRDFDLVRSQQRFFSRHFSMFCFQSYTRFGFGRGKSLSLFSAYDGGATEQTIILRKHTIIVEYQFSQLFSNCILPIFDSFFLLHCAIGPFLRLVFFHSFEGTKSVQCYWISYVHSSSSPFFTLFSPFIHFGSQFSLMINLAMWSVWNPCRSQN